MKRFSLIALIAFVCSLPLLMAPSGGFPSRPTFQKVTVSSTDSQKIPMCRTSATVGQKCASVEIGSTGNFYVYPATDAGVGTGTALIEGVRSATGTWSSVNINGNPSPQMAWGRVLGSSGALLTGSSNVLSTSRSVGGVYTINFQAGIFMQSCLIQTQGSTVSFGMIGTTGAGPYNTIGISTYSVAGTLVDPATWVFYCFR